MSESSPMRSTPNELLIKIVRCLSQGDRRKLVLLQKDTMDMYQEELHRTVKMFSLDFASTANEVPVTFERSLIRRASHSTETLIQGSNAIRSLTTASLDTFERLGEGLTMLRSLVFKVDLSPFTGKSHMDAVSYNRVLENGFLPADMNDDTANALRDWAKAMVQINEGNSLERVTGVLQRNPRLRSVSLQLQPNHSLLEIVETLKSLQHLKSLYIEGSDVLDGTPIDLYNSTKVILHILGECHTLQELTFSDIPVNRPWNVDINENFTSKLTRLDLTGLKRGLWTTRPDDEFDCQRIILRCPHLQWLAFPRDLRPQEVTALKSQLAKTCVELTSIMFSGSTLDMNDFPEFMASLTTLTHITFTECFVLADSLKQWSTNPVVMATLKEVAFEYLLVGSELADDVLGLLPPSPVGSIMDDPAIKVQIWRRS
ncbi:MAG: hypothetical protein J3Q66DRAFT_363194 [Benniella sp.]|nr:MAG: hypothetical protein J3Q66DRAFT_363194 [Benniella sp.]